MMYQIYKLENKINKDYVNDQYTCTNIIFRSTITDFHSVL